MSLYFRKDREIEVELKKITFGRKNSSSTDWLSLWKKIKGQDEDEEKKDKNMDGEAEK